MKFKEYLLKRKENPKPTDEKQNKSMPIMFAGIRKSQKPPINLSEKLEPELSDQKIANEHDALSKHYAFNENHASAIRMYTNGSLNINHHLYETEKKSLGMKHDKKAVADGVAAKRADALKHALTHHTAPKAMHVYTGVAADPRKYFNSGTNHTTVKMPAFTSTSLRKETAGDFTHNTAEGRSKAQYHIMRIKVPKGSHGAYVGHHSYYEREREFVLHPGAHIKINHTPYHTHSTKWSDTHYYDAELSHDGVKK